MSQATVLENGASGSGLNLRPAEPAAEACANASPRRRRVRGT